MIEPSKPSPTSCGTPERFRELLGVVDLSNHQHVLLFINKSIAMEDLSWTHDAHLWKIALSALPYAAPSSSQTQKLASEVLYRAPSPARKVRQLLEHTLTPQEILLLLTDALHAIPSVVLVCEIAKLYDPIKSMSAHSNHAQAQEREVLANALVSPHKHMFEALLTHLSIHDPLNALMFAGKSLSESTPLEHATHHWGVLLSRLPVGNLSNLLIHLAAESQDNPRWSDHEPLIAQAVVDVLPPSTHAGITALLSFDPDFDTSYPTMKALISKASLTTALPLCRTEEDMSSRPPVRPLKM